MVRDAHIKIFITNLGKYNEGELIGEWIGLPIDDEYLDEVLERIGISDEPDENGVYYEEYFISDYDSDIDGLKIGEYDSMDDLNDLAERLEQLEDSQLEALSAIAENYTDFDEALDIVEREDFRIYYGCETMTDVAYEVVDECGYLNDVPDTVADYFDYEAFGRDLDFEGNYFEFDDGIVEVY